MSEYVTGKMVVDEMLRLVKEEGLYPEELIDYAKGSEDVKFYSDDISQCFCVDFGGSEGIYIDLYVKGTFGYNDDNICVSIGTIKTLDDSCEAMVRMGALLGACAAKFFTALKTFSDNLYHKGYRVTGYNENGEKRYDVIYPTKEKAMEVFCEWHPFVYGWVYDNETGEDVFRYRNTGCVFLDTVLERCGSEDVTQIFKVVSGLSSSECTLENGCRCYSALRDAGLNEPAALLKKEFSLFMLGEE